MRTKGASVITLKLLLITTCFVAGRSNKVTTILSPTNLPDGTVPGGSGGESASDSVESGSPTTTAGFKWLTFSYTTSAHPETGRIYLSDIKVAGYFLLPVSIFFTLINGFLVALVWGNWNQVATSAHYNASLLCFLLTLSDLALCGLLGLPIGARFAFEEQLRDNRALTFYTEKLGFLVFEFLLIFRMLIIAVQSVDRCLNIMMISRYHFIATRCRVRILCVITASLPLIRILPVAYVLCAKLANVHCSYYIDNDIDTFTLSVHYYTPLTCLIDLPSNVLPNFGLVEIVLIGTIMSVTWLVIVVSNIVLLVKVFRRAFQVYSTVEDRADLNKGLTNSCALMVLAAVSFAITNFPCFAVWTAIYARDGRFASNYRLQFYLILLTFVSLFFHPWLYILRVRPVREMISGMKKKVQRFAPTTVSRMSTSYQDMGTVADPEL